MYSFEGNFRRTPVQSHRGASKKEEKQALLERTQEERRKREQSRKEVYSAVVIQSFLRACKVREKVTHEARLEYDQLCQQIDKNQVKLDNEATLQKLLRRLLYHFNLDNDAKRLMWLCQQLIKNQKLVAALVYTKDTGLFQVKHLLSCCCRYLSSIASGNQPLAVPMRMLEIYTSLPAYQHQADDDTAAKVLDQILTSLISNGYYKSIMRAIEGRVPSSIEYSITAPTPLAASLLHLTLIPLSLVTSSHVSSTFTNKVLVSLCQEMFCQPYSPQISHFVLPSLAHDPAFPFVQLLHALLPANLGQLSHDAQGTHWNLTIEASPWLLCTLLTLSERHLELMTRGDLYNYLMVLYKLVPQLRVCHDNLLGDDTDSEDDDMDVDQQLEGSGLSEVRKECLRLLNQPQHVQGIISTLGRHSDATTLTAVCTVCHTLMAHNKLFIHKTRLLYSLAFNPEFLRNLWYTTASVSATLSTGSRVPLLQLLGRGMQMSQVDIDRIVPLLSMFCSLFSHTLLSLHDAEFYGETASNGERRSMPFRVGELVPMSLALRDACLGLIELAHPDTRPAMKEDYKKAFQSVGVTQHVLTAQELQQQLEIWAYLFKVMVQLVKMLYTRDSRKQFCPNGHWLSKQIPIYADKPSQIFKAHHTAIRKPFGSLSTLNMKRGAPDEEGPPLSTNEVRQLTVLAELPYVVPFEERVKIFHKLIQQDKLEHQGDMRHLAGGSSINIMVRRNYLYEDAFEKLGPENEPNLKLKMQVQLVNFAGLDEAGIDGGGIFREFLSELMKTAFDPNRGFMKYTTDRLLYPNPAAQLVIDNYAKHYFFLGRILGKAIYESMLVELPFASFFMSKILSRTRTGDVDIHHLQSMDPEMYKNLLFLKYYDGDVADLELDFSVVNNDLGEAQIEELKPGGRDIKVTNSNRIEYIYLMADYRLNRQIRAHVNAFRQGVADVVNLEWLRMFDHRELQTLISGALVPIDISDLRRHTNYSGGYHEDHPVILTFWNILENFTDDQKRHLLKFVTSCSRPPLLGFRELYPAFCIHHAGKEDRLPTASTCMNLLKLPEFKDEKTLREKLLYAIESGAGFELS